MWVTSEESGLLLRIDPAANAVSQTVAVGNGPTGVTVGQGAVWVANPPDSTISRVDPASGSVTKIAMDGAPSELAFADGGLWSASTRDGSLALVDTEKGRVKRTVDIRSNPTRLAGAGDRLWVAVLASRATHRGGTLRIVSHGSDTFDSIDPAVSFRMPGWQALSLVYDGLLTFRRVSGPLSATVVPDLATSLPTCNRMARRTPSGSVVASATRTAGPCRRPISVARSNGSSERSTGLALVGLDVLGADRCSKDRCDLSRGSWPTTVRER